LLNNRARTSLIVLFVVSYYTCRHMSFNGYDNEWRERLCTKSEYSTLT